MTCAEIMKQLEAFGDAQTKKVLTTHGAREPFFGVRVADLKTILKKTKKNYELSLELYATGNTDAMYLACLMADETKMTEADLNKWVGNAYWKYLNLHAVPWVAGETDFGFDLGLKWIQSKDEDTIIAGWSTLALYSCVHEDAELNIPAYKDLITKVGETIHSEPNEVRQAMNSFLINTAYYIKDLTEFAKQTGEKIGKVTVLQEGTACKVPYAPEYIQKAIDKGGIGKKRKTARC
jgi:3-methyladenine DNA glycosylase AlkD